MIVFQALQQLAPEGDTSDLLVPRDDMPTDGVADPIMPRARRAQGQTSPKA